MLASPVVSAVVWAAALAGLVWVLVPAIAFALRMGRIHTTVLPDVGPPPLQGDASAFEPRLTQLAELGFRDAGRTRESARFMSPTHWRWQSVHPARWLISPDGRTHATLYRIVPAEPVRLSLTTAFEGGGLVQTVCPGPTLQQGLPPDQWRSHVRGVDAKGLLARHEEQVAAFAGAHGAAVKRATIAEITAIDDAVSLRVIRKHGGAEYFLLFAFLAMGLIPLVVWRHGVPSANAAFAICFAIAAYKAMLWTVRVPLLHHNAQRSHTEDITGKPDDVTSDGTIRATGNTERRLRILAVIAALMSCAWPLASAQRLAAVAGNAFATIAVSLVFIGAWLTVVVRLAGRARGKLLWTGRHARNPASIWTSMLWLNIFYGSFLDWSKGTLHHVLYAVAGLLMLLGVAGWALEKKRGK